MVREATGAASPGRDGGRVAPGRRSRRSISRVDRRSDATDRLIRAGRRLGARGLISAGEGNLSVRLDADRLLVTPAGCARTS